MRFRHFEGRKDATETQHGEEQSLAQRKRAAPEVGLSQDEEQSHSKPGLPLEWRTLATFIEGFSSRQPSRDYLTGFWGRLRPRLARAMRHDEIVREYLARTFWRRWTMRAAAAAAVVALLFVLQSQRRRIGDLQTRMAGLERDITVLKAGM